MARLPPSRAATLERASAIHSPGSFFSLALSRTRPPPLADSASDPRSPTPRYPVITHPQRDRLPSPRWSRNWKRSDTDGRTASSTSRVRPRIDPRTTRIEDLPSHPTTFRARTPARSPDALPSASARAPPGSIFSPRAWTVRGARANSQTFCFFRALFFTRAATRLYAVGPALEKTPPRSRASLVPPSTLNPDP